MAIMIDESAIPALEELTKLSRELLVRMTKGKDIIEQARKNGENDFADSAEVLLNALDALRVQVTTCIAVLDDQMDVIAQEGTTLVVAKHTDLEALQTIRNASQYVEMIMEKKPTKLVNGEKDWNLVFRQVNRVDP
jgi:hypothetical protein